MVIGEKKENVVQIVNQKLCNTCGACFAICKKEAIDFEETIGGYYFPKVNNEKCDHCGLCFQVCPGINFCGSLLNKMPVDSFAGTALHSYIGRAKDRDVFQNSQSGGIVSALLCYALETGLADAAVTVVMDWGKPPRPTVRLARSVKEILNAQKSKYCPVPVLNILKEIKKNNQKVIFVGLPCQIHGLWNIFHLAPDLQEKIILTIGLFCEKVLTNAAVDYLISNYGFGVDENQTLYFKDKQCGGWPGNISIQSFNGKKAIVSSKIRKQLKYFFTPTRCMLCFDKMNVFSDIAIGDPWGLTAANHNNGETVCVIRNNKGLKFIQNAIKFVELREVSYNDVLTGQGIEKKRIDWRGFTEVWHKRGLRLPNYYANVKMHASYTSNREYPKKIQFSLMLDSFKSREELIRYVQLKLKRKKVYQRLFRPVKVLLKMFRL